LFADTASAAKTPGFRRNGEQTQAGQSYRQQYKKSFHVFLKGGINQSGRKYIIGSGAHGRGANRAAPGRKVANSK